MDQPSPPQPRPRPAETRRLSPSEAEARGELRTAVAGQAAAAPAKQARRKKARLLVVEDDPTIAFTLEYMLSREGFSIDAAVDGQQAKELIDRIAPPDLVLLDVLLPHYDGFQLVDHIRGKPDWAATPILMLTSNSQERDIVRALNAGANDYITKPFQLLELIARLRRFCRTQP